MTWGGIADSGTFATFDGGGGVGSVGYKSASGDVSGLISGLQVVGIAGRPLSLAIPSSGDAYIWDGAIWSLSSVSGPASGVVPHGILSSSHDDSSSSPPERGKLIVGSGSPAAWEGLSVGLAFQTLRVSEGETLEWRYDDVQTILSGSIVNLLETSHKVIVKKDPVGAVSINLPPSSYLGQEVMVKDGTGDAYINNITVFPPSGLTIDGGSAFIIRQNFQSMHFMFDGENWGII